MNNPDLSGLKVTELRALAKSEGVTLKAGMKKAEIIEVLTAYFDQKNKTSDIHAEETEARSRSFEGDNHCQSEENTQIRQMADSTQSHNTDNRWYDSRGNNQNNGETQKQTEKWNDGHTGKTDRRHERPDSASKHGWRDKKEDFEESEDHSERNAQAHQIDRRYAKIKDNIDDAVYDEGPVTVMPEGYGVIDRGDEKSGVYVSPSQIQKFKVVTGDLLGGKVRTPKPGEKYAAMLFLEKVNGVDTGTLIKEMRSMMYEEKTDDSAKYTKSHVGILDVQPDGYGLIRTNHYLPGHNDLYVPANMIRRYRLRTGDKVEGRVRRSGENDRYDALLFIERVNGDLPETVRNRPHFEQLTPIFPEEKYQIETDKESISARMIDLMSPIGKGQRGLIVAPPKAGKTTLLKTIALGIRKNSPDTEVIILLVDERPEEVTDMKRAVDADIVYATFDEPATRHLRAAEMVLNRAKRLVEQNKDVVVLIDSLTRLTRSNNLVVEPSGRTLTGGLDPESLYFPKRFFGSARKIENGGSLTVLATALVDTGSRMDDIIYEEFKGTGNMELTLSRELAERRVFPAIDIKKSGTRREEKLLSPDELTVSYHIRKSYGDESTVALADRMIALMRRTDSNRALVGRLVAPMKK